MDGVRPAIAAGLDDDALTAGGRDAHADNAGGEFTFDLEIAPAHFTADGGGGGAAF